MCSKAFFVMPSRENLANKDLVAPLENVDLLVLWDPLDWVDLLASLVVR